MTHPGTHGLRDGICAAMLLPAGLAAHALLPAGSVLLPSFPAAHRQAGAPGRIVAWKVTRVAGSNVITLGRTCAMQSQCPRAAIALDSPLPSHGTGSHRQPTSTMPRPGRYVLQQTPGTC